MRRLGFLQIYKKSSPEATPVLNSQFSNLKEPLIKSLSYFAISIIMQDKEKADANSEAI